MKHRRAEILAAWFAVLAVAATATSGCSEPEPKETAQEVEGLIAKGKYSTAIGRLKKYLKFHPEDARMQFTRLKILLDTGGPAAVLKDLEKPDIARRAVPSDVVYKKAFFAYIEEAFTRGDPLTVRSAMGAMADRKLDGNERRLAEMVRGSDRTMREEAILALQAYGTDAAQEALAKAVLAPGSDVPTEVFAPLHPGALTIKALTDGMDSPDGAVRARAIECLYFLDWRNALPRYRKALADPVPEVRAAAARILGSLKDIESRDALLGLTRDPAAIVQQRAVRALRDLWLYDELGPTFLRIFQDPSLSPAVRGEAADALGGYKVKAAIPALLSALRSREPELRDRAALALGNLAVKAAVPALQEALASPVEKTRTDAATLLRDFAVPSPAGRWIERLGDPDPAVRALAVRAVLASLDPAATRALIPIVGDASEPVELRRDALAALMGLPGDEALAAVLSLLGDSKADLALRLHGFHLVREKGYTDALPVARRIVQAGTDPSAVVGEAIRTLGAMGSREQDETLVMALLRKEPEAAAGLADRPDGKPSPGVRPDPATVQAVSVFAGWRWPRPSGESSSSEGEESP